MAWDIVADDETINRTVAALKKNNIDAVVVDNRQEAKKAFLDSIPNGSEVFQGTSTTLIEIGAIDELESDRYNSTNKKIRLINDMKERGKARRAASLAEYAVGSVNAVTEDGHIMVASASGSQLGPYASTAEHVVLVVGAQKIVKNNDEAKKRVEEHVLPLESQRAMKVYGMPSAINKLLVINKDMPGRIKLILVKEKLGF